MKVTLILALAVAGCAGTPSTTPKTRSVDACERLLKHSLDTEMGLATVTLSDHKYQTRKVERRYAEAYEKIRKDPEFMPLCRKITEVEYACMMRATDPYTLEGCKTSVAKSKPEATEPPDVMDIDATPDTEAH